MDKDREKTFAEHEHLSSQRIRGLPHAGEDGENTDCFRSQTENW